MINILTVHWKDDRWIDIQLKYFEKHIKQPYRVWAFLNYIEKDHSAKFYYFSTENIDSHAIKLNMLADLVISKSSDENDILLFIDGDAFPIADLDEYLSEKLAHYPLIAVKREENLSDKQPHPLFCVTTCKFWKEIKGDWNAGFQWENAEGRLTTDVGGNLLGLLTNAKVDWYPILRSNKIRRHPLLFAIYDNIVYHHAAAFREIFTRSDDSLLRKKTRKMRQDLGNNKILLLLTKRWRKKKQQQFKKELIMQNKMESQAVFNKILTNEKFYLDLL